MFYSPSQNTWFDPLFKKDYEKAGSWPDDAVEYPRDVYDAVVSYRPADKIMVPDGNGAPSLADIPGPSSGDLWKAHQADARAALTASDTTVMRCYEAGIALPDEWVAYRNALRVIISAQSGDPSQPLPTRPAYPEGT